MIGVRALHHVGIAVSSLEAARPFYEGVLGARFEAVEDVHEQKVRVAFYLVGPPGAEVRIELLEPTAPDSPIAAFLEKRGEGLHHVAFTVASLDQRLADLKARNVRLIDQSPRPGAHGTRIAFLHPKAGLGVLTELVEPEAHGHPPAPAPHPEAPHP